MKTKHGLLILALALGLGLGAIGANVAVGGDDAPANPMGLPPEVLARLKTGPEHKEMAWYLGDWDVSIAMKMPGMEMPPTKGTCTYSWLIDGRWMMSRMSAPMMGMPMEWVHIHGYNTMTKTFETIGFDSMSNDAKVSRGNKVTQDGSTYGFQGMMNEWMNGQIYKPFRTVIRKLDPNTFELEVWDPEIGANGMEVMRFTYTRRAK
ncbi:MAG: DUF1579 family protein [Planctomycetes bacterium]|nr:DUF1579 family protein [Planctomycetota bacterium]